MKHFCLTLIFYFLIVLNSFGLDPQFSQFYSNPLYLGPSFAGAVEGSRVTALYRNQWFDMPVKFINYSFSYDYYFKDYKSGVGVLFVKDAAGTGKLGTTDISLMYSYNFNIEHSVVVRPGLSFHYLQNGIDEDALTDIGQVYNPDNTSMFLVPKEQSRAIDVGTSCLVYTKEFWIGTTVDHLLKPDVSFFHDKSRIPIKFNLYGGYVFVQRGRLLKPKDESMTLAFMFKNQQGQNQLDIGVYWHKVPLVFGLWYRGLPPFNSQRGDAVIFLFGYKTRHFNLGYSYDFTVSNLLQYTKGSHEISAVYKFNLPPLRRKRLGAVPCPEF